MVYIDSGLKNYDRLALELSKRLEETNIPEWMIKGNTTLIQNPANKMEPSPTTYDVENPSSPD